MVPLNPPISALALLEAGLWLSARVPPLLDWGRQVRVCGLLDFPQEIE